MFKVYSIIALQDNFIHVLHDDKADLTYVVDPTTAKDVINFLEKKNWQLDGILCTHHHSDHIGGNQELTDFYQCDVFGCALDEDRIPEINETLFESDIINFDNDSRAYIYYTPGHTLHHIMYYFEKEKMLFTGDTLFSMGCGRVFEGTYQQIFESISKLKNLPKDTLIYCGHEYTLANGIFALNIEPDNHDIKNRIDQVKKLLHDGKHSIPVDLATELKTNVFLRAKDLHDFIRIRQEKDQY